MSVVKERVRRARNAVRDAAARDRGDTPLFLAIEREAYEEAWNLVSTGGEMVAIVTRPDRPKAAGWTVLHQVSARRPPGDAGLRLVERLATHAARYGMLDIKCEKDIVVRYFGPADRCLFSNRSATCEQNIENET